MRPVPRCPLAPGEPCTLCKLGATGPEDCPTVYLVMNDPDLREGLKIVEGRHGRARCKGADQNPAKHVPDDQRLLKHPRGTTADKSRQRHIRQIAEKYDVGPHVSFAEMLFEKDVPIGS